jgi:hypothetical protein
MSYTEQFSETHKLLAQVHYSGVTTEQNTSWISMQNYHRAAIVISTSTVATSLDADLEIATDASATGLFTLKSITQLTSSDDNARVVIELQSEELAKPTGASSKEYDYIRLETTPSGAATYTVTIWGLSPRFAPVGVTEWDEVVS